MTRLGLVRHGQTAWNAEGRLQGRADVPLDATGRRQAQALVPVVAAGGWDVLVSSPLLRAVQTADVLAAGTGLPAGPPCDGLRERDYGAAEGMTVVEADRRWPGGTYPGLESLDALADRGVAAVRRIVAAWPGRAVVVVCHGALIRSTVSRLTGAGTPRVLNGTLTVVEEGVTGWQVVELNRAGDLPRHDGAPAAPGGADGTPSRGVSDAGSAGSP